MCMCVYVCVCKRKKRRKNCIYTATNRVNPAGGFEANRLIDDTANPSPEGTHPNEAIVKACTCFSLWVHEFLSCDFVNL